jgi:hypothetical protein
VAQVGTIRAPLSSSEQEKWLDHQRLTSADQTVKGGGDAFSVRQLQEKNLVPYHRPTK